MARKEPISKDAVAIPGLDQAPEAVESPKPKTRRTSTPRKPKAQAVATQDSDPLPEPVTKAAKATKAPVRKAKTSAEAVTKTRSPDFAKLVTELDELRQRLAEAEQRVSDASSAISSVDAQSIKMGRKLVALSGWRKWFATWLLD